MQKCWLVGWVFCCCCFIVVGFVIFLFVFNFNSHSPFKLIFCLYLLSTHTTKYFLQQIRTHYNTDSLQIILHDNIILFMPVYKENRQLNT